MFLKLPCFFLPKFKNSVMTYAFSSGPENYDLWAVDHLKLFNFFTSNIKNSNKNDLLVIKKLK